MHSFHNLFAGLLVVASITVSQAAVADDADTLFDQGLAAYKQGKLDDALASYEAAWKIRKTQDLSVAMAQVEMLKGKHREAAEHLSYALRYFPVSGKKELREMLEKAFADAKTRVAEVRLRVTGDASAPAITVDGKAIDPAVAGPSIFVAAGKRTLEASARGYRSMRQVVDAKEGQVLDVTLQLVLEDTQAERSIVPPVIAFGAGSAGLILGVVAGAVASAGKDSLAMKCAASGACPKSSQGELDTTIAMSHASTAGFVIAGVGAAVGVTLLLLPGGKNKASPRAALHVGPAFVGVKGVF